MELRNIVRQEGNIGHKGIWVRKSGHVEVSFLRCTSGVNAALWKC